MQGIKVDSSGLNNYLKCNGELMETCIWLWQLIELMEFVVAYTVVEIA